MPRRKVTTTKGNVAMVSSEAVVSTQEEKEAVESVIDAGTELLKNSDAMNAAIERAKKFEENNQLSVFDYSSLSADTAKLAKESAIEIKAREKAIWENIIEIGNRLIEVKQALPHGQFESWVKLEFEWNPATARKYMTISKEIEPNRAYGNVLPNSMKALYQLASGLANADDETKEEIMEAVETATEEKGKALTEKEIKEITKPYLEQIEQLKQKQEQMTIEVEKADTRIDNVKSWMQSQLDSKERELKQAQETLANQNKQIKELENQTLQLDQELTELDQFQGQLEIEKEELDKRIKAEANVIVQAELEKERKALAKKEADLKAKEEKISKELKETQSLKNQVEREKDNLYRLNAWIDLISEFNQEFTRYNDRLKTISSLLIKLPNLLELSEKDRKIADQRIYSQMSAFNQNLDDFGKYNIRIQNAIKELDTSVLSVGSIDVEVK